MVSPASNVFSWTIKRPVLTFREHMILNDVLICLVYSQQTVLVHTRETTCPVYLTLLQYLGQGIKIPLVFDCRLYLPGYQGVILLHVGGTMTTRGNYRIQVDHETFYA